MPLLLLAACAPGASGPSAFNRGRAWFEADVLTGVGDQGQPRATVTVTIPRRNLVFFRTDDGYVSRYRVRAIQRVDGQSRRMQEWRGEVHVDTYAQTREAEVERRTVAVDLLEFADDPERFQLQVRVEVEGTRRSAVRTVRVEPRRYEVGGLALGDLALYRQRLRVVQPAEDRVVLDAALPDSRVFSRQENRSFDLATGPPWVLMRVFDLRAEPAAEPYRLTVRVLGDGAKERGGEDGPGEGGRDAGERGADDRDRGGRDAGGRDAGGGPAGGPPDAGPSADGAGPGSDSATPGAWSDTITLTPSGEETALLLRLPPRAFAFGRNRVRVSLPGADSVEIELQNLGLDLQDRRSWEANLEQIEILASGDEMRRLREAPPEQRADRWIAFWSRRDPDPSTPENERLEEHYRRVAYARSFLQDGFRDGALSDRGRIWILHGRPDSIDTTAQGFESYTTYEVWTYRDIGIVYYFQDTDGFGTYRLVWREAR